MVSARESLHTRIKQITAEMISIRPARTDAEPVQGGISRREDMYIDGISRLDDLRLEYMLVADKIKAIDAGMAKIPAEDRRILEMMYIRDDPIDIICIALNIEKATVYKYGKRALANLALVMYGR